MTKTKPTGPTDAIVMGLLKRYRCPTAFHEVRTRFMGNIASPVMAASPLETLKGLWGGELPEFDSIDGLNELVQALVGGLWNRLTEHQNRRSPFHLLRLDVPETRDGVERLALVRRQELDGFVEGLFGAESQLDLPERAHTALNMLADVRSFMAGAVDLLSDANQAAEPNDVKELARNLQKLSRVAESELNEVILACTRARREQLANIAPVAKPTLH